MARAKLTEAVVHHGSGHFWIPQTLISSQFGALRRLDCPSLEWTVFPSWWNLCTGRGRPLPPPEFFVPGRKGRGRRRASSFPAERAVAVHEILRSRPKGPSPPPAFFVPGQNGRGRPRNSPDPTETADLPAAVLHSRMEWPPPVRELFVSARDGRLLRRESSSPVWTTDGLAGSLRLRPKPVVSPCGGIPENPSAGKSVVSAQIQSWSGSGPIRPRSPSGKSFRKS